jgi:hypothetical protein
MMTYGMFIVEKKLNVCKETQFEKKYVYLGLSVSTS